MVHCGMRRSLQERRPQLVCLRLRCDRYMIIVFCGRVFSTIIDTESSIIVIVSVLLYRCVTLIK